VDRKRALDLLMTKEKIVLISTHDPILALMGAWRIVIRDGAVAGVIETSAGEQANLEVLRRFDEDFATLRNRLRGGGQIDEPLDWLSTGES
jgi:hypothetical protein